MQILYRSHRNTKVRSLLHSTPVFLGTDPEPDRFGWFWECPNGRDCMYRHALPPGFVLKSQKKAMEEAAKANEISLEEFLEVEVSHPRFHHCPIVPSLFYLLPP
jgi:hypothetical protein